MTPTQICNLALGWLGGQRITSLDVAEDSKEWLLCSENYEPLRDAVLSEREWGFAVERKILDPATEELTFGLERKFLVPQDSVRVLTVHDSSVIRPSPITAPTVVSRGVHDIPEVDGWEIEGKYILAGAEVVYVRYNKKITETGLFSSTFIQALAQRIAADLALPLTESRSLYDRMWAAYEVKLSHGAVTDGLQGRTRKMRSRALTRRR